MIMCDGVINEKLRIIEEIAEIEGQAGSQESIQKHMTRTLDELKKYKDKLMSSMRLKGPSAGQAS
jgi:hypothetical protein